MIYSTTGVSFSLTSAPFSRSVVTGHRKQDGLLDVTTATNQLNYSWTSNQIHRLFYSLDFMLRVALMSWKSFRELQLLLSARFHALITGFLGSVVFGIIQWFMTNALYWKLMVNPFKYPSDSSNCLKQYHGSHRINA